MEVKKSICGKKRNTHVFMLKYTLIKNKHIEVKKYLLGIERKINSFCYSIAWLVVTFILCYASALFMTETNQS